MLFILCSFLQEAGVSKPFLEPGVKKVLVSAGRMPAAFKMHQMLQVLGQAWWGMEQLGWGRRAKVEGSSCRSSGAHKPKYVPSMICKTILVAASVGQKMFTLGIKKSFEKNLEP